MPRNYYYIVNISKGSVLTTAGTSLVVSAKKGTQDKSQLWFMDSTTNSYIQNVGNGLVAERQSVGPPDGYWVNLVTLNSGNPRQRWSYPVFGIYAVANDSDGSVLDLWASAGAVYCGLPIGAERAVEATNSYLWQFQVAGQIPDDEDSAAPESVEQNSPPA